jgi:Domain of unknown function (DUF4926)
MSSEHTAMFEEHEVVVLRRDQPEVGLVAGDMGAVVGVYGSGGYEVEFTASGGETVAVMTLGEDAIRRREAHEILHVRPVPGVAG